MKNTVPNREPDAILCTQSMNDSAVYAATNTATMAVLTTFLTMMVSCNEVEPHPQLRVRSLEPRVIPVVWLGAISSK